MIYLFRLSITGFLAAAFTLSLFYVMQSMISKGAIVLDEVDGGYVLDFVRVKEKEQIEAQQEQVSRMPAPQAPPPMPDHMSSDAIDPGQMNLTIGSLNITPNLDINGGVGINAGDGDYLPLVKVAPVYPRRALSRGIEGWVILEFTVSETGKVINPKVIEANPANVFDRAAMQAVLKFKYKPRVVDDRAVEVAGIQHKISFKLQK